MWKCGKLGAANVEMWKCGKLKAANKNHDFSFLRYSLKFMFSWFDWVSQCLKIMFFLFLLAVPMFLSSWSWFLMVSIGFYNGFDPDHENHCRNQ